MQPLPSSVTASVFTTAANAFDSAARHLDTPAVAARELESAAKSTYQGVPSLLMTTTRDSGSRELAPRLKDAAEAAFALAKQLAAGTPAPAGARAAIDGWTTLALDAASLVGSGGFGGGGFDGGGFDGGFAPFASRA